MPKHPTFFITHPLRLLRIRRGKGK